LLPGYARRRSGPGAASRGRAVGRGLPPLCNTGVLSTLHLWQQAASYLYALWGDMGYGFTIVILGEAIAFSAGSGAPLGVRPRPLVCGSVQLARLLGAVWSAVAAGSE
jgi:hypothetical protein